MSNKTPKVHHNTIFSYCNDVATMRHFYTDLLGLEETYFDDEQGWLTYSSGTLQVVFVRAKSPLPVTSDWGKQPSYQEGKLEIPSWVIQIDYADFDATIERIKSDASVTLLDGNVRSPRDGHKSFWLRDPMETTIELYASNESVEA